MIDHGKFGKMSSEEEAVLSEHFERLKKALADGMLILAGPCVDGVRHCHIQSTIR
ncbi:hypothetical protein MUO69_02505 [Candidatus Bathyarchaeota archaeon]|nr:hypothetical protein [Candidatus Bathyarchaeota archaeon]